MHTSFRFFIDSSSGVLSIPFRIAVCDLVNSHREKWSDSFMGSLEPQLVSLVQFQPLSVRLVVGAFPVLVPVLLERQGFQVRYQLGLVVLAGFFAA